MVHNKNEIFKRFHLKVNQKNNLLSYHNTYSLSLIIQFTFFHLTIHFKITYYIIFINMGLFLIVLVIILAWYFYQKEDPEPIFGIYKQRGKWFYLKYIVIRASLIWRKVPYKIFYKIIISIGFVQLIYICIWCNYNIYNIVITKFLKIFYKYFYILRII